MTQDLFFFIANIAPCVSALAVIICMIDLKAKQPYIRVLGIFQLLYVLSHITSIVVKDVFGGNQNYVYSIYNIIELAIIFMVFYHAMGGINTRVTLFAFFTFAGFAIVNLLFIQQWKINSYSLIYMSIVVILYCIYYFYWLIQKLPTAELQRLPMFWVSSAWLIFYAGTLFLFTFIDYLVLTQLERILQYWTLHNILKTIESTMIAVALWIDLRNTRSRSSLA
jgi:hypothetical protein